MLKLSYISFTLCKITFAKFTYVVLLSVTGKMYQVMCFYYIQNKLESDTGIL